MRTLKHHQRTKKKITNQIDGSGSTNSTFQIIAKQVIQHGEKKIPRLLTPNFPLFNPNNFVGRESALKKLHQNLQKGHQTVLMNGLGGIGKTSVAQMYCHLHHENYQHFVWLSQTDTFENACLNAIALQKNLNCVRLFLEFVNMRFAVVDMFSQYIVIIMMIHSAIIAV